MAVDRKNTAAIDFMKFFCALLVVSVHTQPFSFYPLLDRGLSLLTRVAVPYFFIASSFFFFSGMTDQGENWARLKKYLGRLTGLYLLWSAIYLPFTVTGWLADGNISFDEITRYLFKFFFLGSVTHLWFLIYLAYAVGLVFLLRRRIKIKGIAAVAAASYVLGLSLTTYGGLFRGIPFFAALMDAGRGVFEAIPGVFFALPCVTAGLLVARRQAVSKKTSLFCAVGFFLLYTAERFWGYFVLAAQSTVLWLFLLPLCVFLFLLTLKIELPQNKINRALRHAGTIIYASHYIFIRIFSPLLGERPFWLFIAVTAASGLFALIILNAAKNPKLAWLKYLY